MLNSYLFPCPGDILVILFDWRIEIPLLLTSDQTSSVAEARDIRPEHLPKIDEARAASLITVLLRIAVRNINSLVLYALE